MAGAIRLDALRAGQLVGERGGLGARSDSELVEMARAGRNPAFAELVRRHEGRVRALLLRLSRDPNLSDDLAQDVFLRAYRALPGFRGDARLSTWLYRIAYNVFLNHQTRSKRAQPLPAGFDPPARADDATQAPAQRDLRSDLSAAIERLPERYRSVLTLHYAQGVSYPELAERLGLPLGTVKTQLHRAKKMLRAELQDWDGSEGR